MLQIKIVITSSKFLYGLHNAIYQLDNSVDMFQLVMHKRTNRR